MEYFTKDDLPNFIREFEEIIKNNHGKKFIIDSIPEIVVDKETLFENRDN